MWSTNVVNAEDHLRDLVYTGENYPRMYFTLFERILNETHATLEAECGKVHDAMKIRNLLRKIKNDKLAHVAVMIDQKYDSNPCLLYTSPSPRDS